MPCPAPITVFERAWVLSGLAPGRGADQPAGRRPGEPDRCPAGRGSRHRRRPADRRRHHGGDPRRVGPARPSGGPGQPVGVRPRRRFLHLAGGGRLLGHHQRARAGRASVSTCPAPGRGGALSPGGRPADRGADRAPARGRRLAGPVARLAVLRHRLLRAGTAGSAGVRPPPRRWIGRPAGCWTASAPDGSWGRWTAPPRRPRTPSRCCCGADDGAAGRRRRGAWTRLPARIRRRGAPSTVVRQGAVLSDTSSLAPRCSPPADWPASVRPAWTDRWWIAVTGQQKQQLEGLLWTLLAYAEPQPRMPRCGGTSPPLIIR